MRYPAVFLVEVGRSIISGGFMGFWNRLVLLSSLVVAAPVLAETGSAAEGGTDWEQVRERLLSECGDPDFSDTVEQWSVLSCWEKSVQGLSDSGEVSEDIASAFFMEIEVRRSFLEGVREGEASCGPVADSGVDEEEIDGEDGGYDSDAEDDAEMVTVCHRSGQAKRADAVTIEVPADVADRLVELGGYQGPCSDADERRSKAPAPSAKKGDSKKKGGDKVAARENKSKPEKANKNSDVKKKAEKKQSSAQKNQNSKKGKKGGKR
jgi:hypothetical protein